MRRYSGALVVLLSAAGLFACGSPEQKDSGADSSPHVIGPAGGSVALDDVRLEIPRDALNDSVPISVALIQPSLATLTALSPAYQFAPAGLKFNTPAKLTFTLATADADARIYRGATADDPLQEVPGSTVQGSVVSAPINGFSYYVVAKSSHTPQLGITTGVFESDGIKYSAAPVSNGEIDGFGYTFVAAAGVNDGDDHEGRVWYMDDLCASFRLDGTGLADVKGGADARYGDFPLVHVGFAPGAASVFAPSVSDANGSVLNRNYQRRNDLKPFRWGVRLTDDGNIYKNFYGHYELLVEGTEESISGTGTFDWDPDEGPGDATTTPYDKHDFCYFREKRSTSLSDTGQLCLETPYQGGLGRGTRKSCYSHGMLNGEHSIVSETGVTLESGHFTDNRPSGGWTFENADGTPSASGSFGEFGTPQGKWQLYDSTGNLTDEVTFSGTLTDAPNGYYIALDGTHRIYGTRDGVQYLEEEGVYSLGQRNTWWNTYNSDSCHTSMDFYDAATQIETGQWCYLIDGKQSCVDTTRSWLKQSVSYSWATCTGPYVEETMFDQDGHATSTACFSLSGTCAEPVKGASRGCPSVTCQ